MKIKELKKMIKRKIRNVEDEEMEVVLKESLKQINLLESQVDHYREVDRKTRFGA